MSDKAKPSPLLIGLGVACIAAHLVVQLGWITGVVPDLVRLGLSIALGVVAVMHLMRQRG